MKIAHVTIVEIEVSPWVYEKANKDGTSHLLSIHYPLCHLLNLSSLPIVISTAGELGIVVLGYSPLGRGFLTGKVKTEDLGVMDFRRYLPRFQEEVRAYISVFVYYLGILLETDALVN